MNIDRYRPIVAVIIIVILVATNIGHLLAYSNGTVVEYSAKWDMPQVKLVTALLLIVLIICASFKPQSLEEE